MSATASKSRGTDREDLLADAHGLFPRAEWRVGDGVMVVGWRRDAGLNIYLGQDRVIGLSASDELRRVHDGEIMYRADRDRRLVRLDRTVDADGRVVMVVEVVPPAEAAAMLTRWSARLAAMIERVSAAGFQPARAEPPDDPAMVRRLIDRLNRLTFPLVVADGLR